MSSLSFAISGAALGISISAPVGPMGILCINRTLNHGLWAGVSTGAGATTVQLVYCTLLLLGLQQVPAMLNDHGTVFSLLGAALMLFFAWRVVTTKRHMRPNRLAERRSLLTTYATAVLFNSVNPMLVFLLLGGIATLFNPGSAVERPNVALSLVGLVLGSMSWWVCLAGASAAMRARLDLHLIGAVNKIIGLLLVGLSAVTIARVFGALL